MKCPKCKARLLPVDGEMFCLQCGNAVHAGQGVHEEGPALDETTDPLLQKAILDTTRRPVHFKLPVSQVQPAPAPTSFTSMRTALSPPRAALMPAAAGGVVMPGPLVNPEPTLGADRHREDASPTRQKLAWQSPSLAWIAGVLVFGLFLGLNVVIYLAFSGRVYPGVRVGNLAVGGVDEGRLAATLARSAPEPQLSIHIGAAQYAAAGNQLGSADTDSAAREAMAIGHNTPLPLAGLLQAMLSKPVEWSFQVNNDGVLKLSAGLAGKYETAPSDAVPVVYAGQAFVVSGKSGNHFDVDKNASKIAEAIGKTSSVSLQVDQVDPKVNASAYSADIQAAQSLLSLKLQITSKGVNYQPSLVIVGNWFRFAGPGKGLIINADAIASYVAGIPGNFDRAAATSALQSAVQARQDLSYAVSTRKTTAAPSAASTSAFTPMDYRYCVQADTASEATGLAAKAAAVFGSATGWAMGGRLSFEKTASNCNFTVTLLTPQEMTNLSQRCAHVNSCESSGILAVNTASWQAPPKGWSAGIDQYRTELLNHELGHWLGFEHAPCTQPATATPVLSTPTVVLDGCSPNWFEVPAEAQSTKVWASL